MIPYHWKMYSNVSTASDIEICELDTAYFLPAPRLTWQACLKKKEVELELLVDIDALLIVEKEIKGGMCHVIHRYVKANNKCMKDYDPSKEFLYLMGCKQFACGWLQMEKRLLKVP